MWMETIGRAKEAEPRDEWETLFQLPKIIFLHKNGGRRGDPLG